MDETCLPGHFFFSRKLDLWRRMCIYRISDIVKPISMKSGKEANHTSQNEWNHPRRFFAWGIFAFLAVVIVSIAVSAFLFATRPVAAPGTYYPFFFFPFPLFFIFGFF